MTAWDDIKVIGNIGSFSYINTETTFIYTNKVNKMLDITNYVDEVIEWFNDNPKEVQDDFLNSQKEDLCFLYHHNLGGIIRDHFKLWENKWQEDIIDGIDNSPYHPDAISMRIIEAVYDKLKKS